MAKMKFDVKGFLLRKGEVLVMAVSGFFLAVLLIWGATKWTSAKDPTKTADELKRQSKQVYARIDGSVGQPDPADEEKLKLPPWLTQENAFKQARVADFALAGPIFDPTAQPNTKRDNPLVAGIGDYQVDLIRGAMLGIDMTFNEEGEASIAVLIAKSESKLDDAKIKKAADAIRIAAGKAKGIRIILNNQPRPPQPPQPPGGVGGLPGPGGPPGMGMPGGPGGPHGLGGGGFDNNAGQRVEKAIKYIPLKELDAALKAGNLPAFTVIPLRLVTVHAVVPYKKQVDELKRALRLPNPQPIRDGTGKVTNQAEIDKAEADARQWGPWYDGFEVQRKVSRVLPDGTLQVIQDWPDKPQNPKDTTGNYKFEELYIDKIHTRKIADHFDEGFIPYFLKPEMMLAMPLPQLAKDLNVKYPEVELKDITDNIKKLEDARKPQLTKSEITTRLGGGTKKDIYSSKTGDGAEGLGLDPKSFGGAGGGPAPGGAVSPGPVMPMGPGTGGPGGPGGPRFPEGFNAKSAADTDIENFLLRFVDCDARPGYTYEYRIRLRMTNPNFQQEAFVANPEYAKASFRTLVSNWRQTDPITVPAESFLYAHDVKAYREKIDGEYPAASNKALNVEATPETKAVNNLLQVRDNQAVLQVATWMEQVRTGTGTGREPVGAWVVSEMPVGRGEFVGRKQFIKLPLWSAETQQYLLREVGDKVVKGKVQQPRGWLVDFSTKSVLVDFEGGRVKTKTNVKFDDKGNVIPGGRVIEEDAATEVLIVRPDGKLVVRSSHGDDADPSRKAITTEWARWVKEVEGRKSAGGTGDAPGEFDPKGPKAP